jgi:hypothetical protein
MTPGEWDPRDEAASLREHPLPPEPSENDKNLPTRIAELDRDIAKKREELSDLEGNRVLIMDHAIKNDILEDDKYRIEKKIIKGNRVASLDKLREMFPDLTIQYLNAMREKIKRDLGADATKAAEKMLTTVNLGIADVIFGKENVTRCSQIPESIEWKVVKKK